MTLKDYIEGALRTATYYKKEQSKNGKVKLVFTKDAKDYLTLGILGEAGEICDKIKKLIRDHGWHPGQPVPEDQRHGIALEIGDVLWYLANIVHNSVNTASYLSRVEFQVSNNSAFSIPDLAKLIGYDSYLMGINAFREDVVSYNCCVKRLIHNLEKLSCAIGYTLTEVANMNLEKLASRYERNMICGSGDER